MVRWSIIFKYPLCYYYNRLCGKQFVSPLAKERKKEGKKREEYEAGVCGGGGRMNFSESILP